MWVSKKIQDRINESKKTDGYWVEKAKLDYALELDKFRRVSGLSGKTLAEKLGTSAAYISRVFRGDTNLTIESMVKLARATGAKVEIKLTPELATVSTATTHTSNIEPIAGYIFGKLSKSNVAHNADYLNAISHAVNTPDFFDQVTEQTNPVYAEVA
jgi:transcriptional regulator with XRE-family HTH domain